MYHIIGCQMFYSGCGVKPSKVIVHYTTYVPRYLHYNDYTECLDTRSTGEGKVSEFKALIT
jgi:hypothetical protein